MIAVIDYEAGNLRSVAKAIESLGGKVEVTGEPKRVLKADKVVLPGVGAFGKAVHALEEKDLKSAIKEYIGSGRPFLGICLGLQLLYEESEENPGVKGFGIIPGKVVRFPKELKVPHLGWNTVLQKNTHPLWNGIPNGCFFYFAHSYYGVPSEKVVTGWTEYGISFASAVALENVFGVQFHPEKSQKWGLKLLENFIKS